MCIYIVLCLRGLLWGAKEINRVTHSHPACSYRPLFPVERFVGGAVLSPPYVRAPTEHSTAFAWASVLSPLPGERAEEPWVTCPRSRRAGHRGRIQSRQRARGLCPEPPTGGPGPAASRWLLFSPPRLSSPPSLAEGACAFVTRNTYSPCHGLPYTQGAVAVFHGSVV